MDLLLEEGMPLASYRSSIVEFSELFQFCQFFSTTPDKIKSWKDEQPDLFKQFRAFFSGMAKAKKDSKGSNLNVPGGLR